MQITFEIITQNERIKTYIRMADASLQSSGFTEHSFAHVIRTADFSGRLLEPVQYLFIIQNRCCNRRKTEIKKEKIISKRHYKRTI